MKLTSNTILITGGASCRQCVRDRTPNFDFQLSQPARLKLVLAKRAQS